MSSVPELVKSVCNHTISHAIVHHFPFVFQNPDALFLKSNYEYVRGNYPKAIKLLNSAPLATIVSDRGQSMMTLFYNNMSCIHFRMKKFNLAVFYARKALEENITAMKSLPPIETFDNNLPHNIGTFQVVK